MKEAMFHVWNQDHFRFIHLTAENPVESWDNGGETDEGYSFEYECFTLDPETGVVTYEQETSARDCDGKMYTSQVLYCQPDKLAALVPHRYTEGAAPFKLPDWQVESREQRDYEAEKAGY